MPAGLLNGIRVLDLGTGISAPWCAKILADYGAEVIKVETPGTGDATRPQNRGLLPVCFALLRRRPLRRLLRSSSSDDPVVRIRSPNFSESFFLRVWRARIFVMPAAYTIDAMRVAQAKLERLVIASFYTTCCRTVRSFPRS